MDTPTLILYSYFNFEKPLGHSTPGYYEREAVNQREINYINKTSSPPTRDKPKLPPTHFFGNVTLLK